MMVSKRGGMAETDGRCLRYYRIIENTGCDVKTPYKTTSGLRPTYWQIVEIDGRNFGQFQTFEKRRDHKRVLCIAIDDYTLNLYTVGPMYTKCWIIASFYTFTILLALFIVSCLSASMYSNWVRFKRNIYIRCCDSCCLLIWRTLFYVRLCSIFPYVGSVTLCTINIKN